MVNVFVTIRFLLSADAKYGGQRQLVIRTGAGYLVCEMRMPLNYSFCFSLVRFDFFWPHASSVIQFVTKFKIFYFEVMRRFLGDSFNLQFFEISICCFSIYRSNINNNISLLGSLIPNRRLCCRNKVQRDSHMSRLIKFFIGNILCGIGDFPSRLSLRNFERHVLPSSES